MINIPTSIGIGIPRPNFPLLKRNSAAAWHGGRPIDHTHIIEAHGGEIRAEPNSGGGTVFRFTLPAVSEAEVNRAQ